MTILLNKQPTQLRSRCRSCMGQAKTMWYPYVTKVHSWNCISEKKKKIKSKRNTHCWIYPEESVGLAWSLVWIDLEKILINLIKVKKWKSIHLNIGGQPQNNHRDSVPFPIKQKLLSCKGECCSYSCHSNGMSGVLVKLMPWEFLCLLIDALWSFTCKNTQWTHMRISPQS